MDVSSFLGALTGNKTVKIDIHITPPADLNPQKAVPMDHYPSWKLHKNPFWRVKHPGGNHLVVPANHNNTNSTTTMNHNNNNNNSLLMPQPPNMNMGPQPNMNMNMGTPQPPNNMNMNMQPNINMNMPPQQQQQPPNMNMNMNMNRGTMLQQQQQPQQPTMGMMMNQPNNNNNNKELIYAFESSQDVEGYVVLRLPPGGGSKVEHLGIKVQFIGRIDMGLGIQEIGTKPKYDFISLSKELSPPSTLYQPETVYPFKFKNMDKELESYRGRNVAVRYIVKVIVERKFLPPIKAEQDVWVQLVSAQEPVGQEAIKMEVGIEDCLHIEFEYERRMYHLEDTIRGQIHFLLVRIKIKHMELAVIRRETSGEGVAIANTNNTTGPSGGGGGDTNNTGSGNIYTETQTLVKYEIMDGAPVKGEVIPVKLCLKGIPADLTPTFAAVNNRFSVRYFLNLVLVDEDDRRYFKQQEIILWRKELG